jgi:hypothetical protein
LLARQTIGVGRSLVLATRLRTTHSVQNPALLNPRCNRYWKQRCGITWRNSSNTPSICFNEKMNGRRQYKKPKVKHITHHT